MLEPSVVIRTPGRRKEHTTCVENGAIRLFKIEIIARFMRGASGVGSWKISMED
jgi:hypothetical protein